MKTLFRVTIAVILTLTLTLTACTTAQTGGTFGGGNAPATTAAQLARQLNAMHEGSARVSGDTVTLTRNIPIQRNLTVPEGVTLDLTGDWGLWIHDMTLTVNGTVNARGGGDHGNGWEDGGLNINDGATVINGNGTINLTSKGNLFNIWGGNGRKLTLDGVTLVGVPDNDESLLNVNNGGELVMVSGTITGNTRTNGNGGGVAVWRGTFTMSGGAITGNTSTSDIWVEGGGVSIGEASVFTMSGGKISGNNALSGGGIHVGEGSTFIMSGGTISNNTADQGGGGGVRTRDEGTTFTMSGGMISGNSCVDGAGGVQADRGSVFTMLDGEISGNSGSQAGGVIGTTFIMEGGIIFGNTATDSNSGGGVLAPGGTTFTMKGGRIQGNTASDGFAANTARSGSAALRATGLGLPTIAKWGTGGTYTKGGVNQTGGSDIVPGTGFRGTNDTLIAIPAR